MPKERLPVNVLTGFLGSGKTTLLKRLLQDPGFSRAAVLINEFGEVGLDHLMVERIDGDVVLMKSGCVCCTVRGDLARSMRDLLERREARNVPEFDRLLIETTGLADPVPVVATVMHDAVLMHHLRVGNVLTVVDAVHGLRQLYTQPESRRQAAIADRLILSKTDLPDGAAQVAPLRDALRRLNPTAALMERGAEQCDAGLLLGQDVFQPESKSDEVRRWLRGAENRKYFPVHAASASAHRDIESFTVELPAAIDWSAFCIWLSMLVHRHGDAILRIKGVLLLDGAAQPVAIHAVQRLIHAPIHLEPQPDMPDQSVLVFIVQGLSEREIRASLVGILGRLAGTRARSTSHASGPCAVASPSG